MRSTFVTTLLEMADKDERLFLLTADMGWSVIEPFAAKFPRRFLNVGVAEGNMVGIATGLAQVGFIPFVYSIATFASMSAYEQLRNGPVLHRLPVRIIGIGGGYAYGLSGSSHYALEDLAIMRCQPGLTVIAPADPPQTRTALLATRDMSGPVYMRIGKGGNPDIPGLNGRFALGRPEIVVDGSTLLILCTGTMVTRALKAARLLDKDRHSAAVAVLAHLGFGGSSELRDVLARFKAVITVEEGYAAGGLGSLVAETIAREGLACRLRVMGVQRPFSGESGSADYMRDRSGLGTDSLVAEALSLFQHMKGH